MNYTVTTQPRATPRTREETRRWDERIRPNGSYVLGGIRESAAKLYQRLAATHRQAAMSGRRQHNKASADCESMSPRVLEAMARVEAIFAHGPLCSREEMEEALAIWDQIVKDGQRLDVILDVYTEE